MKAVLGAKLFLSFFSPALTKTGVTTEVKLSRNSKACVCGPRAESLLWQKITMQAGVQNKAPPSSLCLKLAEECSELRGGGEFVPLDSLGDWNIRG